MTHRVDAAFGESARVSVMFIGELMKLAEQSLAEGLHPRLIAEAQSGALERLSQLKRRFHRPNMLCICICNTYDIICMYWPMYSFWAQTAAQW